jgi:hypothetical protein
VVGNQQLTATLARRAGWWLIMLEGSQREHLTASRLQRVLRVVAAQ